MKEKLKKGLFVLEMVVMSCYCNIIAWASSDEDSDELIDFITAGPADGRDPFGKATEMVKNTGASAYQLAMVLTVVLMLICFIMAGIRYAWCKGQRHEESKDSLLSAFVGGAIAFAAGSLVLLVKNIAGGLF